MADATLDTAAALSALLDRHRLAIAGALVGRPCTIAEISTATGIDHRRVLEGVATLRHAGLVEASGDTYVLPVTNLRALAGSVSDAELPMDPWVGYGMTEHERQILSRFFRGRTLTRIPTDRPKRLIVLERIALEFDVGRRYPEASVNDILRTFHPDVAALRRYLVDEDILSRAHERDGTSIYWRTGGRVEPRYGRAGESPRR